MSSHHIVRDDQEPALIIANGEACSMELLNQLLEWSPFVVVLDSAIERVAALNIKVDVLLGDFDHNFTPDEFSSLQFPIEIIHTPDQDKTDLEKAIDFLIDRKFPAVNIVWATGKRADHSISNMTNIVRFQDKIKIVMLDDYSKIFRCPDKFEKWYTKGSPISLIPVGKAGGIMTQNLKWELTDDELILGYKSGNSNEVSEDGLVKISYTSGDLLLMECYDL
ncbi:thiamine diphosphokinase [Flavobacterium silvaticum]|uniref:Thiamine diphosphokinase n=1 Tax=Flavobacterium silvaticum TaxID=1852020 RepID=A0A972FLN5_9FLAO|nr:thiamine diphosphokinase [Flavobacterium silvaticum]NMH27932.1 thiamine diphosphokinase [Flavobacterium silvaticum]